MTAGAILPRKGRRWGDRDDNDGEEEVVEVRWTTTTRPLRRREVAAGKRVGFEESSRRKADGDGDNEIGKDPRRQL
jgi:hypothetical protein